MAKTNKQNKQPQLSPKKYIQTKARALPIHECLINTDWKKTGLANIVICRKHKSGNYTIGVFLVDTFCLGVKNAFHKFNITEETYKEIKDSLSDLKPQEVSYDLVHNIIFGAIEFAQEYGVSPHPDFAIAKYLLEEDTDAIPLIEIKFGVNDKPMLIAYSKDELNKYTPVLKRKVPDIEVHAHVDDLDDLIIDGDDNSSLSESLRYHMPEKKGFLSTIFNGFKTLFGRAEK